MNSHWLVLTNYGWKAFDNEQDASDLHCSNIEKGITTYFVHGSTKDASGVDFDFVLVDDGEE